jgi:hypothetical protein
MYRFTLTILFVYLITLKANSQQYEFGKISSTDFTAHKNIADTSDGALVLFDSTVVSFITIEEVFFLKTTRYKRVLILKDEALNEATVVFEKKNYQTGISRELKSTFEGFTYHLQNGNASIAAKLDSSDIYLDKFTSKVVFPKMKKGCIFDLKSEIEEPVYLNFFNWQIQENIPVVKSCLNIMITEHFDISTTTFGGEMIKPINSSEFEIKNKKGGNYYLSEYADHNVFKGQRIIYSCENISAFHGENYLHNPSEHIKSIHFTINQFNLPMMRADAFGTFSYSSAKKFEKTWAEFGTEYLKNDALQNSSKRVERLKTYLLPKFTADTDDKTKIDSLINFVKKKVEWNEQYSYIPKQSIYETLEKGNGSSADINALLLSLLNALEFTVHPVLISPRGSGTIITKYVEKRQLDQMVVAIKLGESYIFRDATNKFLNNALLPLSAYNGNAALVREDTVEFINLSPDYLKMNEKFQHKVLVKKDNLFEVSATINPTLFRSAELRKSLRDKKSKEGIKNWLIARSIQAPDSIIIENEEKIDEALKITVFYKATASKDSAKTLLPALIWGKTIKNPFSKKSKELPAELDFCLNQFIVSEIVFEDKLPEINLPEKLSANFNEQSIIYQFEAGVFENTINVMSRLKTNKTFFNSKESAGIEEYFNTIIKKQNEKISFIN